MKKYAIIFLSILVVVLSTYLIISKNQKTYLQKESFELGRVKADGEDYRADMKEYIEKSNDFVENKTTEKIKIMTIEYYLKTGKEFEITAEIIKQAKKESIEEILNTLSKGITEKHNIDFNLDSWKKSIKQDAIEVPKKQLEPQEIKIVEYSSINDRTFYLGKKTIKGKAIIEMVKNNENGKKLWQAFYDKHGIEIADTSAISLYYENASFKLDSVGVCSKKYMIGGDYRNCSYADINSAGLDVGLKQINTWYQRYRIEKLSGIKCKISNTNSRYDKCTSQYIEWLVNADNNIRIALDIYEEQGFSPWYGYKKAFKK